MAGQDDGPRPGDQGPEDVSVTITDRAMVAVDDLRAGNLVRQVLGRDVRCVCDCGREFTATGPAASHARAARHVVAVDYRTRFVYTPAERFKSAP